MQANGGHDPAPDLATVCTVTGASCCMGLRYGRRMPMRDRMRVASRHRCAANARSLTGNSSRKGLTEESSVAVTS